jgi:hypothetical protein
MNSGTIFDEILWYSYDDLTKQLENTSCMNSDYFQ